MVSVGMFLKMVFFQYILRNYKLHRLLFRMFGKCYCGKKERELKSNLVNLRKVVLEMIEERREELKT